MGETVGYARVSTGEQNLDLQLAALREAGCTTIFRDVASGVDSTRPELARLKQWVSAGDLVVVWRLDRLGRTMRAIINDLAWLEERGASFRSLTESAIDTTTAGGRVFCHLVAVFADWEHASMVERTKAGLAAARARGKVPGPRPKVSPETLQAMRKMRDDNASIGAIAKAMRLSERSVARWLNRSYSSESE